MARDPLDDLLPMVDDPLGIVGGWARRGVLAGSSDFRAFAEIAKVEAGQDGRGDVQLGDFGVALSLDPRGRRVLTHLGLDFRGVEALSRVGRTSAPPIAGPTMTAPSTSSRSLGCFDGSANIHPRPRARC